MGSREEKMSQQERPFFQSRQTRSSPERMWTKVAGALGASAVGMGAIGAHALPPDLAASYVHGFHGFIDCNHGHTN